MDSSYKKHELPFVSLKTRMKSAVKAERPIKNNLSMKNMITKSIANLFSHLMTKRALVGAVCGLGLLASASGGTILQLDLGNNALAANGAGFTKVGTANYTINNGSYYEWDNVAGSGFTLSMTNIGSWNPGTASLASDGFYNLSGNGPAYFTMSNLPVGNTVAIYACIGWDAGRGGKFEYGGSTNIIINPGTVTNPSISTLQFAGRAVVGADGTVSGRWYGQGGYTSEGQVGALIFDVEPCQPVITLNGNNPMLVPVNSAFTDPGATAMDSCSGSALTVTTNGTVNANTIGVYTITYAAVSDGVTITATRTVNVVLSDFLNLDLAVSATDGSVLPSGFTRISYAANMANSVASVGGTTYTVSFTNVSGAYKGGGTTIDSSGFYCNAGTTNSFYVSGLVPGSQVTLYACWAWDGANNAAIIYYGGASNLLNVGTGITQPSTTTFMNCGTAVADGTGMVSGNWTGQTGHQGQIGGMIFAIQAPVGHTITILPSGVTNSCGSGATFVAAAPGGANYQWYNNFNLPISGATNTTLVLTGLHPSDSGNYKFTATATNSAWTASTSCVVNIYDIAPPIMTMNGNSVITIAKNGSWTDPGATAFDSCAGSSLPVTTNGTVNTSVAGQYNLTYSATTGDGISGSVTRLVYVIDPTDIQPDVQLNLAYQSISDTSPVPDGFVPIEPFDIGLGTYGNASIPDPMLTGSSYVLNLTNVSCWNQSPYLGYYNLSTAGIYNYDTNDVYAPASFTLSGLPNNVVVNIYAVYAWGGTAKAAQIIYAGATNQLTTGITTNSPNPPTQADFQFIGSALANNGEVSGVWYGPGGPATEGEIGAMIINIQSYPAHSAVVSPASVTPQCGVNTTFTATASGGAPFTYQWYDNHTNLIAGATNATYTLVDPTPVKAGNYTVVVQNSFGKATNYTTVTGVVDVEPPVMALNGPSTLNILQNSTYVDAGATAYDLCAQSSLVVTSNSTVNTSVPGSYTVTYSATTANNNTGTITRYVNVTTVPNLSLNLDFASSDATVPTAPAGFTLLQSGVNLASVANYTWPNVAGSIYTLSISNISQYNTANTNEPLTTSGFYKSGANNNPASFTLSGLQPTLKVTLYAIYAWDGAGKAANVFFGGTNAQIVYISDPGTTPTLTNFTKIGSALVGSSGAVNGYWQGPASTAGTNAEGQVGGMVFVIGTNHPPVAVNFTISATSGQPVTTNIINGANAPTDADGDPLTVTAVQSPTPHGGTVVSDGTSVTYTSASGYSGTDTFTYTVGDGFGGFSTKTITVSMGSANQPPVANALVMGAVSGQPASLKIIGGANGPTDPNNDPLTITAVGNPANGTASSPNGTNVTYTSTSGYTGTDAFTYTVSDGLGGFATNTVTVSVVSATGYNHLATPVRNGGNYNVNFNGIPYVYYVLLTTPSLTAPVTWTPVATNQADAATGVINFSITPSVGKSFYKAGSLP